MNRAYLIVFLMTVVYQEISAKILIFTHSFNRPDFIEWQYKTFKKFVLDEYEFIVFNDAPQEKMAQEIQAVCDLYNIRCIRIPQRIHTFAYLPRWKGESFDNPCVRCANVVQYSLNVLGFQHNDIVVIIDSDMFLATPFSFREFLKGYQLAGHYQYRGKNVKYLWNGIVFLNMPQLPDRRTLSFNCGKVNNEPVDVGGQIHHYLKNHRKLKVRTFELVYPQIYKKKSKEYLASLGYNDAFSSLISSIPSDFPENYCYMEFFGTKNNPIFVHYRSGGNWDGKSVQFHAYKTKIMKNFINQILES